MWEWDRAIVRPLALDGFARTMAEWRDDAMAPADEPAWETELARGRQLLERYFDWAITVDDFVPVRVATDFSVRIPDPDAPGSDLATRDGRAFLYEGRIDLLAIDADDNYWMVEHRPVAGEWAALHDLVLEERATSFCWAWEQFFLGMRIAGVVHNEVRLTDPAVEADQAPATGRPAQVPLGHRRMYVRAGREPVPSIVQEATAFARRTRIPRSRAEIDAMGTRLADEAREMADLALPVYPNPSPANCGPCEYTDPCVALNRGADPVPVLAASFLRRGPAPLIEGRLGGVTWSMGRGAAPPRFGRDPSGGG